MQAKVLQVVLLNKRIFRGAAAVIMILSITAVATNSYLVNQENKREIVQLEKNDQKTLFFYRDDCPDCKRVFKQVYLLGSIKGEPITINLNQEKNRKYISAYNIDQVPTIIQKDEEKRYEGSSEIQKYLGKNSFFQGVSQ